MYLLGAFLVYAGLHMVLAKKTEVHPEKSRISGSRASIFA